MASSSSKAAASSTGWPAPPGHRWPGTRPSWRPPPAGSGCGTIPAAWPVRDHLLDRSSRFGRAGDLGHEDPVGAGVQQSLEVAPGAVRHPDEHGEAEALGDDDGLVRKSRVSGLCSMSTTTNSKPAAAGAEVSRLGSLTHVPNVVGPGPRRPAGAVTASGTRRGSAPNPAAERSPCGAGRRCRSAGGARRSRSGWCGSWAAG